MSSYTYEGITYVPVTSVDQLKSILTDSEVDVYLIVAITNDDSIAVKTNRQSVFNEVLRWSDNGITDSNTRITYLPDHKELNIG